MKGPDAKLFQGDCLDVLPAYRGMGTALVFCDLPYGTTSNPWDSVIPFEPLWAALKGVSSGRTVYVFTATQPFSSALVMSQPKLFKHELIWVKSRMTGFLNAKKAPMRAHEGVYVFSQGGHAYNPQKTLTQKQSAAFRPKANGKGGNWGLKGKFTNTYADGLAYPTSIIKISSVSPVEIVHPTQKPTALLEWLIATYSNPGDIVVDPTMGSGTTGVACARQGRRFVGIERDPAYFKIAQERINAERAGLRMDAAS